MGLIGSIAGGVTSLVGGIAGAKAANKGYNDAIKSYEDRLRDIKAHRDALYYQDPTQSAENMAAVTNARELMQEQAAQTAAKNVVAGGTDESVAMAKAAGVAAVGKMLQDQAVQGASKRESIYNNASSEIDAFTKYLAETKKEKGLTKAKNITSAAKGLSETASSLPW